MTEFIFPRKIKQASLCLRFQRREGWTRDLVAKAFGLDPGLVAVRHFEGWIDEGLKKRATDPCYDSRAAEYYAVYNHDEADKIPSVEELRKLGYVINVLPGAK